MPSPFFGDLKYSTKPIDSTIIECSVSWMWVWPFRFHRNREKGVVPSHFCHSPAITSSTRFYCEWFMTRLFCTAISFIIKITAVNISDIVIFFANKNMIFQPMAFLIIQLNCHRNWLLYLALVRRLLLK